MDDFVQQRLVHKIYSALYFPHGDFVEAKLGVNLSFAQRGIWEATKVLVRRRRWRIGDGLLAKVGQNLGCLGLTIWLVFLW